jgi:WD40 repeat protein
MDDWKMNLLCVSEKHEIAIFAIQSKLHVFELDTLTMKLGDKSKVIDLRNEDSSINNIRLVTCSDVDFLVCVDMGAHVRMFYLDNLDRDPIKFQNIAQHTDDNSTWSCDGVGSVPPRVVVGSNAHTISIMDLQTEKVQRFKGHKHNVPSVSFSPCGQFIASTSIDRHIKIWKFESQSDSWELCSGAIPDSDWGWAIRWVDKNHCLPSFEPQ